MTKKTGLILEILSLFLFFASFFAADLFAEVKVVISPGEEAKTIVLKEDDPPAKIVLEDMWHDSYHLLSAVEDTIKVYKLAKEYIMLGDSDGEFRWASKHVVYVLGGLVPYQWGERYEGLWLDPDEVVKKAKEDIALLNQGAEKYFHFLKYSGPQAFFIADAPPGEKRTINIEGVLTRSDIEKMGELIKKAAQDLLDTVEQLKR